MKQRYFKPAIRALFVTAGMPFALSGPGAGDQQDPTLTSRWYSKYYGSEIPEEENIQKLNEKVSDRLELK